MGLRRNIPQAPVNVSEGWAKACQRLFVFLGFLLISPGRVYFFLHGF